MNNIFYFKSFIQKSYFSLCHLVRRDILLSSWIFPVRLGYVNNNFGDDINIPLLKALTGKKVVIHHSTFCNHSTNILCIGSIIEGFSDKYSIIWGSGALHGMETMKCKPKKVCAVRGPLTRDYLMKQEIECPTVYGDPALLFPLIYTPNAEKKYKLGIVTHYVDYNLPHVKTFREQHPEVLFIKLRNYESWQTVIDEITFCEAIASSSLHGLIISDAYHIPNVRVKFSNEIEGGDFKYRDYFGGVNRVYLETVDWTSDINIELLTSSINEYKILEYTPKELLKAFPYKLTTKFRNIIETV